MSTSRSRATPIGYMGPGNANVLWELHPRDASDAAYHRGASIALLSQFAAEEEVLFPPCTLLVVQPAEQSERQSAESAARGVPRFSADEHERCEEEGKSFINIHARPCFV